MTQTLTDLCYFADGRVAVADLDLDSYLSTESMLPNKEGITRSSRLPTVNQTQAYQTADVLVSNIRPYFRKIWFADRDGGCSNDVLVLRAKETCNPGFLYYLLSDNNFFDYATATGKGTKMPRGDKGAIMRYVVPDVPLNTQIEIADTLSAIDARIGVNKKINQHIAMMSELPSRARRKVRAGDIVFSTVRPNQCHYGLIANPLDNMLVSTGFAVLHSVCPSVSNEYLYILLSKDSVIEQLQAIAEQSVSTYPSIKPSDIADLNILIPTADDDPNNILRVIYRYISCGNEENRRLAALRDTLLPRLMSGEISLTLDI